jgi:UDP-N-acetylmuramoyl-tripeptide--D-alanyl-D-alanine ligase
MTALCYFTLRKAAEILKSSFYPEDRSGEYIPRNLRTDSRLVMRGDGFIAINGKREDGHNYIAQAAQSGASCIILEREYYEAHAIELSELGVMLIPVEDTIASTAKLAGAWLEAVSPEVIGITGSVGKTTTREFLYAALKDNFRTHASAKSYNTLIGASMTVLSMPGDTEILILELGTNHPGEIAELVKHFPISHGIITEISDAHLEGLRNIAGVLEAKMELTESEALEFLSYNSDNELLSDAISKMPLGEKAKKGGIRQISVGYSNSCIRISDVRQVVSEDFEPRLFVTLSRGEKKLLCASSLFGKQHAKNIAFAYAAAVQMGLDDEVFQKATAFFKVPSGRGVIKKGKNECVLIDETYNANPSSVSYALKNLLEMKIPDGFKRIAILGGMRELGNESNCLHDVVLNRAALLDEVYLVGDEWAGARKKNEATKGLWKSTSDFEADLVAGSFHRSVILLKGSRYYEMERLLSLLEAKENVG